MSHSKGSPEYWQALSEDQRNYEIENPDPWARPAGPLHQATAEQRLLQERERYESGENIALMGAIRICVNHDLPLPQWASRAYIKAYGKVLNCESNSWDEVFGKPYPGKHLDKLKQRQELRIAIYSRVVDIRNAGGFTYMDDGAGKMKRAYEIPVDEVLFEDVGAEFGIGKTLCNELYYEAKKIMR